MNNKIARLAGTIVLALLLVCGLITGLASAGSPSLTSLQLTGHLPPVKFTPLSSASLQQ